MREILSAPPAIPPAARQSAQSLKERFQKNVMPTYSRFDVTLERGKGSRLWDINGKSYIDFAGGIAVCGLGHAHPEITRTIADQAGRLMHISNLYFQVPQGNLAEKIVGLIGPGKVFFCNSGGEANEGLFKLTRKFGHDEGRYEILTAENSFHGRTLAAISATGQDKVKKGFAPMVPGFRHVPFNDLAAMRNAISPATAAILIEGVQGEGGVVPASPEYLLGLRQLCDEKKLLLLIDSVQCGIFRTGRFQSFQRILEGVPGGEKFLPDGIAMAKALGAGFPMGAFWVRAPYADLLTAGSHGSTYGGSPLACAVGCKVLEIMERDHLADKARSMGEFLKSELAALALKFSKVVTSVRGIGMMIGLELADGIPAFAGSEKSAAVQFVNLLHEAGLMAVPAGTRIIRILPALNLPQSDAVEGLHIIEGVVAKLSA